MSEMMLGIHENKCELVDDATGTIDLLLSTHSSIRRVLSLSTSAILLSAIVSVTILIPKILNLFCRTYDTDVSNLIQIITITALCSNFKHLHTVYGVDDN